MELLAQGDTIQLPEVSISAVGLRNADVGSHVEYYDSLTLSEVENVAGFLTRNSGVFVKSYGLGSLATTAIRGGSAEHTAVVWNGFKITSPMLGQLDLALLPSNFVDQVQITFGGNSTGWGSGGVSGIIQLKNRPSFDHGFSLISQSTIGSFGWKEQQLQFGYSSETFATKTRLFFQEAENDYPFRIRKDLPEQKQTNFALKQKGVLQEVYWKIKPNQQLALHLWLQEAYREIPPRTTQRQSLANQADGILRATLHWKSIGENLIWQARTGFFYEQIDFRDDLIELKALSNFKTLTNEIEVRGDISPNQQFQLGINQMLTTADADGYRSTVQENLIALFGYYQYYRHDWQLRIGARQALLEDQLLSFVPTISFQNKFTNWLQLKTKLNRDYRHPTLNERFWSVGGNPDLFPESGWSQELGINTNWEKSNHRFNYSITGFNRNIRNWIRWSPDRNGQVWSPQNIARVWSRGLEQRLSWNYQLPIFSIGIDIGHDFIRSTNQVTIQDLSIERGEQLLYVPKQQAFIKLHFRWKQSQMIYRHTYTSSIETILDPLADYHVANLSLHHSFSWKWMNSTAFIRIENLWNEQYRVVERRIMPGRHYRLGLRFNLN